MFIVLWERILRAFNSSSKELQSPKMDLSAACRLLNCTKNELQHIRESWDSVVETATAISCSWNIKVSFYLFMEVTHGMHMSTIQLLKTTTIRLK